MEIVEKQMNVVITGANKGIGLELVKCYQDRGEKVFAIVRKSSAELDVIKGVTIIQNIDLVKLRDFSTLSELLSEVPIDILINNAGIMTEESIGEIDYEQIINQLMVNSLGPLKVTECLLSQLKKDSRVALITSRMGSISDNDSGGHYGYRASKAALNAIGVSLAKDLESRGIFVGLLHPGFVRTSLVDGKGDIEAGAAAKRLVLRIDEMDANNSGSFLHASGEALTW